MFIFFVEMCFDRAAAAAAKEIPLKLQRRERAQQTSEHECAGEKHVCPRNACK
jgi:hypothetical protein